MYNISYIYINMCVCVRACEKVFIIYLWENLRWNLKVAPSNGEKTTCKSAIGRASFRSNCMGCIQVAASTRAVLAKS